MNEKFEKNRKKQLLLGLTAFVGSVTVIMIGSSILNSKKNNEKDAKKTEMPHIKYIDSGKVEKESFKETYGNELMNLKRKQEESDKKNVELQKELEELKKKEIDKKGTQVNNSTKKENTILNGMDIQIPPLNEIEKDLKMDATVKNPNMKNLPDQETKIEVKVDNELLTIEGKSVEESNEDSLNSKDKKKKDKDEKFVIPAGSFMKSILLTGLDAPTFANAKSEPHPVVIRITEDANLPNNFKTDIKECRAIASGYGELSSDRAIIRVESISCMKKDGSKFASSGTAVGFVTGEDGKIGLSGRVVSKQGAILARTMAAGFVEGMGEVFKQSSQTINTTAVGTTTTTLDPSKATQIGIYGGVGEGAKKLSDYYLKLNDQMFPVVEINVGRKCDIVLNKSVTLKKVEEEKDDNK